MSKSAPIEPQSIGNLTALVIELPGNVLLSSEFSSARINKSTDGGATWVQKKASVHPNANPRVHFTDSNGNIYFSKGLAGQSGQLFRSADNGETWTVALDTQVVSPLQYSNAFWYMIERANGDLYINEYSFGAEDVNEGWQALNIYKSTDDGVTWSVFYTYPDVIRHLHGIYVDANDVMYITGSHIINGNTEDPTFTTILNDNATLGATITPQGLGGGMTASVVADNGSLIMGSDRVNGVYEVVGTTFVQKLNFSDFGLPNENILALAKGRDGVLYTVTNENGRIFASDDDGQTWVYLYMGMTGWDGGNPSTLTVGLGTTPTIFIDRGYLDTYYTIKDYTRAELRALYTSSCIFRGDVVLAS